MSTDVPLSPALRIPLAGIVGGVVLLGYVPGTQQSMYVVLVVSMALYLLVRGGGFLRGIAYYATCGSMLFRWAFVLWALASLFWIGRGGEAVQRAVTLLEIHAVGAIIFDASRNARGTRWILEVAFVSAAAAAVFSLVTGLAGGVSRVEGAYGNPNTLAVTSLVGLVVFHSGAIAWRSLRGRVASHVLAVALAASVVASSSLKGIAGLVVVWAMGLVSRSGRGRAAAQIGLSTASLAVLISCADGFRAYWEQALYRVAAALATAATPANFGESLVKRARLIDKGIDLMGRSPIVGRGLDSFRWMSGEHTYAHNNYIDLGVALGVIGLVLFYAFYAGLFVRALSTSNRSSEIGRFILFVVPLMMLLEIGAVTYMMKTVGFLLLAAAGWIDMKSSLESRGLPQPRRGIDQGRPAWNG